MLPSAWQAVETAWNPEDKILELQPVLQKATCTQHLLRLRLVKHWLEMFVEASGIHALQILTAWCYKQQQRSAVLPPLLRQQRSMQQQLSEALLLLVLLLLATVLTLPPRQTLAMRKWFWRPLGATVAGQVCHWQKSECLPSGLHHQAGRHVKLWLEENSEREPGGTQQLVGLPAPCREPLVHNAVPQAAGRAWLMPCFVLHGLCCSLASNLKWPCQMSWSQTHLLTAMPGLSCDARSKLQQAAT